MSQENLYLENRKVLKVSGLKCVEFLNNILTSDITKLIPFETIPSALLSPQGRVLFDMLVSIDFPKNYHEKSICVFASQRVSSAASDFFKSIFTERLTILNSNSIFYIFPHTLR